MPCLLVIYWYLKLDWALSSLSCNNTIRLDSLYSVGITKVWTKLTWGFSGLLYATVYLSLAKNDQNWCMLFSIPLHRDRTVSHVSCFIKLSFLHLSSLEMLNVSLYWHNYTVRQHQWNLCYGCWCRCENALESVQSSLTPSCWMTLSTCCLSVKLLWRSTFKALSTMCSNVLADCLHLFTSHISSWSGR